MVPDKDTRVRLARSRLYLLLCRRLCRRPPLEVLSAAIEGGCDMVQIREPEMADGALVEWVRAVRRAASSSSVLVIVNNRADVAVIAGADGVHIGQSDLRAEDVRAWGGDGVIIGLSTHARAEVERSNELSVDYVGLGPVFDTATKGLLGRGLDLLRDVLPIARKPAFAIGGITVESVPALKQAGVGRIAVSRAICSAADPAAAARAFSEALGSG